MLGSAPFRRTQFLPELILSSRRVPENYHRGGGGRNCGEPCARLRDGGASFHNVAHLPRGLRGRLLCYGQDHVFARIRICRCAKCEHEHDTCTSNRPAACATEPASCFHALILPPFRIFASLFQAARQDRKTTLSAIPNQSVQRKCSKRRWLRRAFASSLLLPPAAASFS